jgi:cell division protein FtsI (penicillin-binding protein 3)
MSLDRDNPDNTRFAALKELMKKDSSKYYYAGSTEELRSVMQALNMPFLDSSGQKKWAGLAPQNNQPVITAKPEEAKQVPDVKGMGLRDALYLLESRDMRVVAEGTGKVSRQSIPAGAAVERNQKITIELN